MLTLACAWGPGTTSPGRPREEEEASESPSSCKNIRHPAAPRGLSPSGNTAPGAPPCSLPEASRSLFPQLFLHGPRRRVGGEGRRKGVRVGCLAGMWELGVQEGSLAEGPESPGAAEASGLCQDWETEARGLPLFCSLSGVLQVC